MKKLTVKDVSKSIIDERGNLASVGRRFGVSRQAVSKFVKVHELTPIMEQSKDAMTEYVESQLFKAIDEGNVTAILFYLKCHGGYVERSQQTVSGEHKVVLEVIRHDG